jgi:hypothetical protein
MIGEGDCGVIGGSEGHLCNVKDAQICTWIYLNLKQSLNMTINQFTINNYY